MGQKEVLIFTSMIIVPFMTLVMIDTAIDYGWEFWGYQIMFACLIWLYGYAAGSEKKEKGYLG